MEAETSSLEDDQNVESASLELQKYLSISSPCKKFEWLRYFLREEKKGQCSELGLNEPSSAEIINLNYFLLPQINQDLSNQFQRADSQGEKMGVN